MKHVIGFLCTVGLGLVFAFAEAAALSKVWSWYVAPQYGAGPHYSTWYGITLVFGLLVMPSLMHTAKEEDGDKLSVIAGRTLGMLIVLPLTLGVAWCTGQLFGWM